MEAEIIGSCWSCGGGLSSHDYGRETNCLQCGKPTRVCRNCRWYDTSRPNSCQEPVAEEVQDKERANFCDFFEPTDCGESGGSTTQADLQKAAEELFKV
jgi:predicted RNA-binding Zn-ribbon protein involved in translation (DUF1610 family)